MRVAVPAAGLSLLFAVLLSAALGGCAHRVVPPHGVEDPVTVYLIDYGRHASIALPTEAGLTEWFWGDWNYYALRNRSLFDGVEALFASAGATLGRRQHDGIEDLAALCRGGSAEAIFAFPIEQSRSTALRRRLQARFSQRRETLERHADGREFVRDETEEYDVFNTSAHKLAEWLRDLGASVEGSSPAAHIVFRGGESSNYCERVTNRQPG